MSPQELKALVKIEDILSNYIAIVREKEYRDLRAHCPFHHGDKNPSFSINGEKQFFYCYGCKEAGDVFKFIQLMEKVDYSDAVRIVAQLAGISFAFTDLELLNDVAEYYKSKVSLIKPYLYSRRLTDNLIETFNLGYAGEDLYELYKEFKHQKDALVKLKLINPKYEGTNNEIFPSYFYNRLIFPITSHLGIVSFSGRTLINDHKKYLNANNSAYFNRNAGVYGLDTAIPEILKQGFVFLVEGFLDKIRMYHRGYYNCVSILGSALTIEQAKLIRRFTNKVVMLYDGDEGGYTAVKKTIDTCLRVNLQFEILTLPDEEDPDSYLIANKSLETLEFTNILDFMEEEFTKQDILKIIDSNENLDLFNREVLDYYKINIEIHKRSLSNSIKQNYPLFKLDKWDNLFLLVECFPSLNIEMTEDEKIKVLEASQKPQLITLIANDTNYFKKVKDPIKTLENIRLS
jgi:DNA primase